MKAGKLRLIFILGCLVIIMGFFMAPSRKEVALMRLEDKNFNDAFEYYKKQYIHGEKSINILAPLIKIYIYYGYIDKAIGLLELYIAENPNSIEGRKQLTALYKSSEYYYKYCESLEELQKLVPSTRNLQALSDTYSFLGMREKEMEALARLIKSKHYHPMEEDYVKLASLYMADHQHDKEAIDVMLDFFSKDMPDTSISTVHLTLQLLADNGMEDRAFSIAKNFLGKQKKKDREDNAVVLSGVFHRHGDVDYSYKIIEPYVSNMDNSPQLLQRFVEIQIARNKHSEVYADLSKRFEAGKLPAAMEIFLLDLAMLYHDHQFFETVLNKADIKRMPEESLIYYSDYMAQFQKPELAIFVRNSLGKEYLQGAPLLTILLEIAEKRASDSIVKLSKLPTERLFPEHKMILVGIFLRYNEPKLAYALIEGMPVADTLYVVDPAQFANIYLAMDQANSALKRISLEKNVASPQMQALMDVAVFMINVGKGNEKVVQKWLSENSDVKVTLLEEAYALSHFYKHLPIALNFASRIYKIDPKPRNRIEFADTLMLNNQFENGLKLLQPLAEKDGIARSVFLNGMGDWVRKADISEKDKIAEKIDKFVDVILNQKRLSYKEKQDTAYLLVEAGLDNKAENIFMELAAGKPYEHHDVGELLGFWGDKLSGRAVDWLQNKVNTTSGAEQSLWLAYANDTDNPQIVISALQGLDNLEAPVADQYINALIATRNYDTLRKVVNRQIAGTAEVERLEKLASIGIQENLPDVSANGWRKLYSVSPGHKEALKELGMLAFSVNHYTEAQSFLEKYLEKNKGDYRINSAYGEMLLRKGKTKQAAAYFEKARHELAAIKTKNTDELVTEAFLLYRSNHVKESLELYQKILAQYPDNKSIRADFIQVLIDNKQFKEASLLLSK